MDAAVPTPLSAVAPDRTPLLTPVTLARPSRTASTPSGSLALSEAAAFI